MELERSSAVLVLVGQAWRGEEDQDDRLKQRGDWVRREVETALGRLSGRVLPIVVEGAAELLDRLPASMRELSNLQRAALRTSSWEEDVDTIVTWVQWALAAEES